MSHDAYIRFEGVDARLDSAERPGWARLLSFRHNVAQTAVGSAAMTGDTGPGRASHSDFVIHKLADEASPRLALMCCNGFKVPRVTVEICDSASLQLRYLQYRMTDVIVASAGLMLGEAGDKSAGGGGRLAQEQVSLRYGSITWGFTRNRNGEPLGETQTTWDVQRNTGG